MQAPQVGHVRKQTCHVPLCNNPSADPLPALSQCPSPPFSKGHHHRYPVTQVRTPGVILISSYSSCSTPIQPTEKSGSKSVHMLYQERDAYRRDEQDDQPSRLAWACPGLNDESLTSQKASQSQANQDNWSSWKGGNLGGQGCFLEEMTPRREEDSMCKAQNGGASVACVNEVSSLRHGGWEGDSGKVGRGWVLESDVLDLTT